MLGVMTKSIRVQEAAHREAKDKASKLGMKIASFVELAIQVFDPTLKINVRRGARHRKAG